MTQTPLALRRGRSPWGLWRYLPYYGTMAYFIQTMNVARPKIAADLNGMPLYPLAVSIPSIDYT